MASLQSQVKKSRGLVLVTETTGSAGGVSPQKTISSSIERIELLTSARTTNRPFTGCRVRDSNEVNFDTSLKEVCR